MRIVLFVVLLVLVGAGATVAAAPLAWIAGLVADRMPGFTYASASGSVWNGRLGQVFLNSQEIGDVSVALKPGDLLAGRAAARLGLIRSDLSGESDVSYDLASKRVLLRGLKVAGSTGALAILPFQIRALDGEFKLDISEAILMGGACEAGAGSVWSDVLTRGGPRWGWRGPELTGVVRCKNGAFSIDASGHAEDGEQVTAEMAIAPDLTGRLLARVLSTQPAAADALTRSGFVLEDGAFVLRTTLGPK